MIAPETIDQIAEMVSDFSQSQIQQTLDEIQIKQPAVFAYLTSDNETYLLRAEEKQLLFYTAMVIWEAVKSDTGIGQRIGTKALDDLQYNNWQLLENLLEQPRIRPLETHLETIIDAHSEAEMLYFVCDCLEEEEEFRMSKEVTLSLFVMLKTVLDALTA